MTDTFDVSEHKLTEACLFLDSLQGRCDVAVLMTHSPFTVEVLAKYLGHKFKGINNAESLVIFPDGKTEVYPKQ